MKGNQHQRSNNSIQKQFQNTQMFTCKHSDVYIKANVYVPFFKGPIAEDMFSYMLHAGANDLAGKDGQKVH